MAVTDPDPAIRVVLVDDHAPMRRSTRRLLEGADVHVVGEAAHGGAAVGVVVTARPDVVLMDLRMPGVDGVEATRLVRSERPETQVLVLTTSTEEDDLVDALIAGAVGYVLKDARREELLSAVRSAARGDAVFSPAMAARLARHVRSTSPPAAAPRGDGHGAAAVDDRERELLRRLALGEDNATIGRALHLSPHTVKGDVSQLLAKLGLRNRVQAAVWAVRHGVAD